ncbi:PD-(D/E)XK nuclease family protein [Pseudonocardia sp. RS11V-5]|uniref:RecB family exonuclease n=1 Tax=Pseudonocardia terrae TaxID=2905831 RepID=UPI001E5CE5E5|nr:PD-(D/E)XK nuclease family protein [Pseudonocardia terrae]MCE3552066.1 PD-(D/E)XK nuclease family protein [Pseudonocardia terrae]
MSELAGIPATVPVPGVPGAGSTEDTGAEAGPAAGSDAAATADPHAAEERRRPALSPSRAADFKQCPLLYRFRAVDRLPEAPSAAALRGTLVHSVLERLFDLPAADRVPARAKALVGLVWAEIAAETPELAAAVLAELQERAAATAEAAEAPAEAPEEAPEEAPAEAVEAAEVSEPADLLPAWLASAEALLDTYFALEDPRSFEPQSRELLVETELGSGVPLRGYLDRLDVDAEGGLRIVDYKTGTAPREASEARALFQMKFYALALLELHGTVPEQLRLVYLGEGGEELTYRPEAGELRRFQRILEAIWAAIREADRTGDFRPRRGPGCAWCAHRALCPAWDGTPPPYPGWPELRAASGPAHGDAHGGGASSAA